MRMLSALAIALATLVALAASFYWGYATYDNAFGSDRSVPWAIVCGLGTLATPVVAARSWRRSSGRGLALLRLQETAVATFLVGIVLLVLFLLLSAPI